MHTIYTFGYSGSSPNDLCRYVEKLGAVLIDVRWSPRSRAAHWNKGRLSALLDGRYLHLKALGNENYKGGPVKLHDPDSAAETLAPILAERPIILMCACKDVDRCHRKDGAEFLSQVFDAPIVHLPPRFENFAAVQLVLL